MRKHISPVKRLSTSPLALWLPPLIWMALIFVVSGTPPAEIPEYGRWDVWIKKGGHMAAYAVLTLLWARALRTRRPAGPAAWLALCIALLYAISDEYHQTFVAGRHGTAADVLVDMVGGVASVLAWHWFGRVRTRT